MSLSLSFYIRFHRLPKMSELEKVRKELLEEKAKNSNLILHLGMINDQCMKFFDDYSKSVLRLLQNSSNGEDDGIKSSVDEFTVYSQFILLISDLPLFNIQRQSYVQKQMQQVQQALTDNADGNNESIQDKASSEASTSGTSTVSIMIEKSLHIS